VATRSRRRFDDDDFTLPSPITPTTVKSTTVTPDPDTDIEEPVWSTYPDAAHGPGPLPPWVITSPAAIDTDLGVMKSGKEADVSLLRRAHDGREVLLAVKQYRDAQHRMFHRDAGYLEGRRVRRSRETRAMATRTEFGRELIAGQWASAEFAVLAKLWSAGAAVPYPVQLMGTELMMEFIGDSHPPANDSNGNSNGCATAAPRLAQLRPDRREALALYEQLHDVLSSLTESGYAHGDLSAYNILVHHGRLVLIDLPQAVDLVGNPQGFDFLHRDCRNICAWFEARGVHADADDLRDELMRSVPRS
jgi:RIO kinase 1